MSDVRQKIDIHLFKQWGRLEFEHSGRSGALFRALLLLAPPPPLPAAPPAPSADRRRVGEREAGVLRGRFSPRQPFPGRGRRRRRRAEDDPGAAAALQRRRRRRRHHEAFVVHASDATGMGASRSKCGVELLKNSHFLAVKLKGSVPRPRFYLPR